MGIATFLYVLKSEVTVTFNYATPTAHDQSPMTLTPPGCWSEILKITPKILFCERG